jgi:cation diffusion facilitator family transporter
MHPDDLSQWTHGHDFAGDSGAAEKNMRRVLWLTAAMRVVEVAGGLKLRSMALFADGCHMGTHVAAFAISAGAYWLARRHADDERFSFGTGKIGVLAGYTSAVVLGMIALYMFGESILRLVQPRRIAFGEAIPIACLGLAVNLASALLLRGGHHHHHGHDHHHHHDHGHEDLNLRSAYVHVIADAVTSVLAIAALTCGRAFGRTWLDPVCGIVGSAVIGQWSWSLIASTQTILVDREPETSDLRTEIRKAFAGCPETAICDLHVWQVGAGRFAAIVSIVAAHPEPPGVYKRLLAGHEELLHVTIEVNPMRAGDRTSAIAPAASGRDAARA